MAPAASVVCPSCGARNKTKWEFCARCGESLQGVAAEGGPAKKAAPSGGARTAVGDSDGFNWRGPLLALVTVALLYGAWAFYGSGTAKPDPGLFQAGTRPPAPRAAAKPVSDATREKFEAGRKLLRDGNATAALEPLSQAAGEAPDNAEFIGVYAEALWQTGARDNALARFHEAASLDPAAYRMRLAKALNQAGKPADAAREYEALVRDNPNDYEVVKDLGLLLVSQGNFAGALPQLKKAQELQPDAEVSQQYGYALEKTGDRQGAADVYRTVLTGFPEAAATRSRLAEVLIQQGNKTEAIALIREGIALTPEAPLLRRSLGAALERANKMKDAAREYREYARLAPDAEDAKALMERANMLDRGGQ